MSDFQFNRERYLEKIRAVEVATQQKELEGYNHGGNFSPNDYISSNADGQGIPFSENFKIPEGSFIPSLKSFTSQEIRKAPAIINAYRQHSSRVEANIEIDTDTFDRNGRISLPNGSRSVYTATMVKLLEEMGGISRSGLFSPIDETKFDNSLVRDTNPHGNWIRKDMNYYLATLHARVTPKLGVNKLHVTSGFRSIYHNYAQVYGDSSRKAWWSPHIGGFAVDIAARGNDRYIIAREASAMGFGGIAIGRGFVHLDIGPHGRWAYPGIERFTN